MSAFEFVLLQIKMSTAQTINTFIYFLQKLPLIGKHVPDRLYSFSSAKSAVGVIGVLFGVFGKIAGCATLLLFSILASTFFLEGDADPKPAWVFMSFFLMCCFCGGATMTRELIPDKNKYICVRIMGIDARRYELYRIFGSPLVTALCYFPATFIGSLIIKQPVAGLLMPLIWYSTHIIFSAFWITYYKLSHRVKGMAELGASVVITFALYILTIGINPDFDYFSLLPYMLLLIPAALAASYPILKFNKFYAVCAEKCTASAVVNTDSAAKQANFQDVALNDKKSKNVTASVEPLRSESAESYLCRIFLKRHVRIMIRPTVFSSVLILVAAAIAAFIQMTQGVIAEELALNAGHVYPVLVFIMYVMSSGQKCAKAMFYNCDISLLRFPFYRTEGTIMRFFVRRLKTVALLNAIPAVLLGISLSVLAFVGNAPQMTVLMLLVLPILLSLFFSVHHISMYYIFQPYTISLDVSNPFFKVINTVVYVVSFLCLQIDIEINFFAYFVCGLTIIYIIAALLLVKRYAPKRFRVK